MSGNQLQPEPPSTRKPSVNAAQRTRKRSVFYNPPDIKVVPLAEFSRHHHHGHGFDSPLHRPEDALSIATDDSHARKVSFIGGGHGGTRQRGISVTSQQSSDIGVSRRTRKISASSVMSDYRHDRRQLARRGFGSTSTDRRISEWFMKKPPQRYANTYKMTSDKPFSSATVRKTIETELEQYISGLTYEPSQMGSKVKVISDDIKQMVKLHGFGRYKIVCTVTLGQNMGQGFRESSKCLWDDKSDSYVTVSYHNGSVYIVVTVFALFCE